MRPVLQGHPAVAVRQRLNAGNSIQLDDGRPVNTQEFTAVQPAFQQVERLAQQMHLLADMQPRVIAHPFDPIDLG